MPGSGGWVPLWWTLARAACSMGGRTGDYVRAAIPRGIDPAAGEVGGLDALSIQDRFDALGLDDEARSANEAVRAGT